MLVSVSCGSSGAFSVCLAVSDACGAIDVTNNEKLVKLLWGFVKIYFEDWEYWHRNTRTGYVVVACLYNLI